MLHRVVRQSSFVLLAVALFGSTVMRAQQQPGAIAGTVRDASGAVLPGVSVEASSPALIEKTRTVVTDTEGRYSIVSLPTGTYAVTFSLAGFTTIKRDGVQLTTGFTAAVNADMPIGSVERRSAWCCASTRSSASRPCEHGIRVSTPARRAAGTSIPVSSR